MIVEFVRGAGDIWRGLRLLVTHPRLWVWALIPFCLNLLLYGLIAWAAWRFVGGWIGDAFFARQAFWADALGFIMLILFWIAFGIIVLFTFVPFAALIASPFNDVLSEKVERLYAGGSVDEALSLRALWRGLTVGLATSLRLLWVTLLLLVCTIPLHFLLPPLGPALATAASAAITIRFLALEFTSYSMDRRYYGYAQRRNFLRTNRWRTIGLGTMAFLIMPIPLVNALFIPISAIAGTLLFCDAELQRAARS